MPDHRPPGALATCNTITKRNTWCTGRPVVVVGGYGYCKRHAAHADGRAYPPVGREEAARQRVGKGGG
jgi:hypothetical protein